MWFISITMFSKFDYGDLLRKPSAQSTTKKPTTTKKPNKTTTKKPGETTSQTPSSASSKISFSMGLLNIALVFIVITLIK